MLKIKYILTTTFLILCLTNSNAQEDLKLKSGKFNPAICYASGLVEKSSIPPPIEYLNRLKSGKEKTSQIIVDYIGFSVEAKASFQGAVDIWEFLLVSEIPIHIRATWSKTLDENVLGSCGATHFAQNFEGAIVKDTYYPIALVEKLLREEATGSWDPDMIAQFNSKIDWYYGIDGNPPSNKYDLISTVLHEIGHGLGFVGFFFEDEIKGGYNLFGDNHGSIFDQFVVTGDSQNLTDTNEFDNPSEALLNELTSNDLWYNSATFKNSVKNAKPRLYAPSVWNDGSSIYHLNDATYPSGTPNSLMTHAAGLGESILNPGPHTLNMLADIGWETIFINHDNLKDIEEFQENRKIEVDIISDISVDTTSLFLFFSKDNFSSYDSTTFTLNETTGKFEALLPLTEQDVNVNYYLSAADKKERTVTKPSFAPEQSFKFSIGPDNIWPSITHDEIPYLILGGNLQISANADDNLGVDTLYVEHFLNGVAQPSFGMVKQKGTSYSGSFIFNNQGPSDGDSIFYKFVAIDSSSSKNTTTLPNKGSLFATKIEQIYEPVNKFYSNINTDLNEFIKNDYQTSVINGFSNNALHSPHPYPEALETGLSFNFTTILKHPIIVAEGGDFSFDEVVLVEPGGDFSIFGDDDFWDYVIVEGSKDNGDNWLPLIDGYDSRENVVWFNAYNQNIVGNNSTTVGTKDLFVPKTIILTQNRNFEAGDTILIRFRLYSDQLSAGWGWAIDNIRIQIPVSNKGIASENTANAYVYPNPFTGELNISLTSNKTFDEVTTVIYNTYGQVVKSKVTSNYGNNFTGKVNVARLPSAMYVVKIFADGQIVKTKKIIKK